MIYHPYFSPNMLPLLQLMVSVHVQHSSGNIGPPTHSCHLMLQLSSPGSSHIRLRRRRRRLRDRDRQDLSLELAILLRFRFGRCITTR